MAKRSVNDIIVEKVTELVEQTGLLPWQKRWSKVPAQNLERKIPFWGINQFLCAFNDHTSPYYLTYKQIQKLEVARAKRESAGKKVGPPIRVREGESKNYTLIFFCTWKEYNKKDSNGKVIYKADGTPKKVLVPIMRYYREYNVEQIEGIDHLVPEPTLDNTPSLVLAEQLVRGFMDSPAISHSASNRPAYRPSKDLVLMPTVEQFESEEDYYSTLFHELAHSTGHEDRLDRPGITGGSVYGDHDYSEEECIAEFTSAYLCSDAGILSERTITNSASYIKGWLQVFSNKPRMISTCAARAQKASRLIKGELCQ